MSRPATLALSVVVVLMIVAACDDYSHNSIVNTPPVNYINLTMMRTYGADGYDWGSSLAVTADNEFVIAGSTTSNGYGLNTVYLSKISPAGNVIWYNWFGGWGDDNGLDVVLTPDSAILVAGVTSSFDILTGRKIDPNSGQPLDDSSFYLIKTNMQGVVLWEKAFGDTAYDEWGTSLAISSLGYVVAGFQMTSDGDENLYLIKVDTDGEVVWQKSHGTSNPDRAYDIIHHSSGGFVVGGYSGEFLGSACDPYLLKINEAGDVLWERILGDPTQIERVFSICETRDGGIVATGGSRPPSTGSESEILYALKVDAGGQLVWQNTYNQTSLNQGRCVLEDSDGALLICGQNFDLNAVHIAKLDAAGNLMWSDSTGATGYGTAMLPYQTGYIITGSTTFPNQQLPNDVLLLKIEEDLTNIE